LKIMYGTSPSITSTWQYKLLLVLGLGFLFAFPIFLVVVLNDSTGYAMIPYMERIWIPALGLFIASIMAFQWYGLVLAPSSSAVSAPIDDPVLLTDWNSLFAAMAVGGDPAQVRRDLRRLQMSSRRGMTIFMAFTTVLALFPVCGFIFGFMSFTGISPLFPVFVVVYVLGAIVAQAVFLVIGTRGQTSFAQMLAPLGLTVTHSPDIGRAIAAKAGGLTIHDNVVIEGQRFNRPVRIEINGAETLTTVGTPVAAFNVTSGSGQFTVSPGAPDGVVEVLRTLRDPNRWKKMDISGDATAIRVRRRGASTGTEWLTDLWLAERIAEHTRA
jgi:hypothetical protein